MLLYVMFRSQRCFGINQDDNVKIEQLIFAELHFWHTVLLQTILNYNLMLNSGKSDHCFLLSQFHPQV